MLSMVIDVLAMLVAGKTLRAPGGVGSRSWPVGAGRSAGWRRRGSWCRSCSISRADSISSCPVKKMSTSPGSGCVMWIQRRDHCSLNVVRLGRLGVHDDLRVAPPRDAEDGRVVAVAAELGCVEGRARDEQLELGPEARDVRE